MCVCYRPVKVGGVGRQEGETALFSLSDWAQNTEKPMEMEGEFEVLPKPEYDRGGCKSEALFSHIK